MEAWQSGQVSRLLHLVARLPFNPNPAPDSFQTPQLEPGWRQTPCDSNTQGGQSHSHVLDEETEAQRCELVPVCWPAA